MAEVDQKLTNLIGYSREAFDSAQSLQKWSSRLQWLLAVIAVFATFLPGQTFAIATAVFSFLGAALITWLSFAQQEFRRFGERVRRATLLAKGLGHQLSTHEYRSIEAAFDGNCGRAATKSDANYYASSLPPGEDRLIENLYESAFWSADLYRHSARPAWTRFCVLAITVLLVVVTTLSFLSGDLAVIASRIVLVVMTVLVSRDVFGDAIAYSSAHRELGLIMERLEALRTKTDKTADLMLVFGDYNSAVEAAPMPQSGVYQRRKVKISRAWQETKL